MEHSILIRSQWVPQRKGSTLPLTSKFHAVRLSRAYINAFMHTCSFSRSELHGPIRAKVREGCRKRLPEAQQGVLLLKVSIGEKALADTGYFHVSNST